jgi:hypothetical protein
MSDDYSLLNDLGPMLKKMFVSGSSSDAIIRDYPVLRRIAAAFKILSVVGGALGALLVLIACNRYDWDDLGFVEGLVGLLLVSWGAVVNWGIAEAVLLLVNIGVDVSAMRVHEENAARTTAAATSPSETP